MTASEAEAIIAEWARTQTPPHNDLPVYGYDVYLPTVMRWYVRGQPDWSRQLEHDRLELWSPSFALAGWELVRRGMFRPGVVHPGGQSTDDGSDGFGFTITPRGRDWLEDVGGTRFLSTSPDRFSELLAGFAERFGAGFHARSQEAVQCFLAGAHLACCAMCGAAVESILLALAIEKTGDEGATLQTYRSAQGTSRIRRLLVGNQTARTREDFDTFLGLLKNWRDVAAHGTATDLGVVEAELALVLLARFANFARDRWGDLTRHAVENDEGD